MAATEEFGVAPTASVAARDVAYTGSVGGYPQLKAEARRLVAAMYQRTQEWLAARGITELVLFRGMTGSVGANDPATLERIRRAPAPVTAEVHLQPLNSWSVNLHTARVFGAYVLTARVPAASVVGSCFTGTGCLSEQEFVVLGGPDLEVTVSYANSANGAAYHQAVGLVGWTA
jgi:hypothetical protein